MLQPGLLETRESFQELEGPLGNWKFLLGSTRENFYSGAQGLARIKDT